MNTISKKKKLIIGIATAIIVLGTVVYALADRYLIEHVELDNADRFNNVITTESESGNKIFVYDDWTYKSETTSIEISVETSGSGDDKVTYYVADIKLTDITDLRAAFADNKFGRNIIAKTSEIANNNDAIFAVNGDYYGFRDNGLIIRNGHLYRNEPCRTGLAIYKDGSIRTYDERETTAEELLEQGVWHTYSFGPVLVLDSVVSDRVNKVKIDNNLGNKSIHNDNPRTGIGMIEKNHFVIVVVDGRKPGYSRGLNMREFANLFLDLGCKEAYNLDGGGSATMFFKGRIVNNPLGKNKERGISDIIYIKD